MKHECCAAYAWTLFSYYLMLLLYCGLCQYMSVLLTCLVCYEWYIKYAPREPIVWGSASQTVGGIFECGPLVPISRFPLCGVRPRGLSRWVVSCMSQPLYLCEDSFRWPLDGRLCGVTESVWMLWRREYPFLCWESDHTSLVVRPIT